MIKKEYSKRHRINKTLISVVTIVLLTIVFYAPSVLSELTPSISLSETEISLVRGRNLRIIANLGTLKAKLSWSSEDESIATINQNGVVTGVTNGRTNINCIVNLPDETTYTLQCAVNVFTPVANMKIQPQMTVDAGKNSDPIIVTFTPEDATYHSVSWSSNNEDIAVVDDKGVVTGKKAGTCRITALSKEPVSGNIKPKSAVCNVTVLQPVEEIKPDKKSINLAKGKNEKITAKIIPENASNKKITWESENPEIASVNNGNIQGKSVGDTIIYAKSINSDGSEIKGDISVHVFVPVSQVSVKNKKNIKDCYPGQTRIIGYDIIPENAEYKEVQMISSDPKIATIDERTGTVTAVSPGQTTITVISKEPNTNSPKSDSVNIRVLTEMKSFEIKYPKVVYSGIIYSNEGQQKITVANIKPGNAANKNMCFISSESGYVDVDYNTGILSPSATGVSHITVEPLDPYRKSGKPRRTAKIWNFNRIYTFIDKPKGLLSDFQKMTIDTKYCCSAMAMISVHYTAQQAIANNYSHKFEFALDRDSYCYIGKDQIWCCIAKPKVGFQVYGYVHVENHDYLTFFDIAYEEPDNLKEYLEKRFDVSLSETKVPPDILAEEVESFIEMINNAS